MTTTEQHPWPTAEAIRATWFSDGARLGMTREFLRCGDVYRSSGGGRYQQGTGHFEDVTELVPATETGDLLDRLETLWDEIESLPAATHLREGDTYVQLKYGQLRQLTHPRVWDDETWDTASMDFRVLRRAPQKPAWTDAPIVRAKPRSWDTKASPVLWDRQDDGTYDSFGIIATWDEFTDVTPYYLREATK